ncbi:MAG: type II toxin-antitoxin system PemK/MazF family toxin [Euryarchaeota archaeon]|nr:type II toxin-antitoxin system PemK/MazF family toxin [Euryarchaeota archaeon]MDE1838015.1 type II toxin-antitoxin system PemK/MazF family toxin [Euryarchaeota archaeon]MDE1881772.1 type II toxin-antitoxin system PemK/MazF family toxin [Euryarchaeota archaeon]MDE2046468.1 type II toxin-antitoxin system PemK/MazF family toxin [Thermoplasmata archaeon]
MSNLSRGDVVWVSFPAPHQPKGFKRRPGLLLTEPAAAEKLGYAVLVPVSSRVDLVRPLSILVAMDSPEGRQMGILTDSRLFVGELGGVSWFAVEGRLGTCPLLAKIDGVVQELVRGS